MCLPVVTVWGHRAESDGVVRVGVGAVGRGVKREVGRCFGSLDIAEPFNGVVVEALAALVAHVLGETVDHEPEGYVDGALDEHGVAVGSLGGKGAVNVVAAAEVGCDLLKGCGFGDDTCLVVVCYLLKLEIIADASVIIKGQEH